MPEPDPNDVVLRQAFTDAELLPALLDHVEEGVYIVNRARQIVYWNQGAEKIAGYLAHEVTGHLCHGDLLMHCDADGQTLCGSACPLAEVLADGIPREQVVFVHHRRGHRVPVRVRARPIHGAGGTILGAIELFHEVVAPARAELAALEAHGCMDELTGAANRAVGEVFLRQWLELAERFGIPAGWIGAELDGVAELEHRYGQGLVEAAVATVAHTLHDNLGSYDALIRWDTTAFRVLMFNATQQRIVELTRKLVALVRVSTLTWWGDPLRVTVSMGAALAAPGDSPATLEARIARALESSRAAGGDSAFRESEPGGTPALHLIRIL